MEDRFIEWISKATDFIGEKGVKAVGALNGHIDSEREEDEKCLVDILLADKDIDTLLESSNLSHVLSIFYPGTDESRARGKLKTYLQNLNERDISIKKQGSSMQYIYNVIKTTNPQLLHEWQFYPSNLSKLNLKDNKGSHWVSLSEKIGIQQDLIDVFKNSYTAIAIELNEVLCSGTIVEFFTYFQEIEAIAAADLINQTTGIQIVGANEFEVAIIVQSFTISMAHDISKLILINFIKHFEVSAQGYSRMEKLVYEENFENFLKAPSYLRLYLLEKFFQCKEN